jgi:hypothetical protein
VADATVKHLASFQRVSAIDFLVQELAAEFLQMAWWF